MVSQLIPGPTPDRSRTIQTHLIAKDEPHEAAAQLTLARYCEGYQIDESGHGPVFKWH